MQLIDAASFAREFSLAKRMHFDKIINHEVAKTADKQNTSKPSAAMRLAKLWRASGPSNSVTAILSTENSLLTNDSCIATEVGSVWSGTFSQAGTLPPQAYEFLSSLGVSWFCVDVRPPLD